MLLGETDHKTLSPRLQLFEPGTSVRTREDDQDSLSKIRCDKALEVICTHGHDKLSGNQSPKDRGHQECFAHQHSHEQLLQNEVCDSKNDEEFQDTLPEELRVRELELHQEK